MGKISSKINILIIDDVKISSAHIRHILVKSGFKNIFFEKDGEAAYNKLKLMAKNTTPIELIICDWKMPKLSGFDLLKKIRDEDDFTPFIMVTSNSDASDVRSAIDHGASEYIIKPLSPKDLINKIIKVFS